MQARTNLEEKTRMRGRGIASGEHAATLGEGSPGVLHGSKSYVLQAYPRALFRG
jgi:tryptophan synthase beta subunit